MRTVIILALFFAAPVIFSAEGSILIVTGIDPSGQTSLTAPEGVCSASNPNVGAQFIPRGQTTPAAPIRYTFTQKGGSISANVGPGTYTINVPAGIGWVVSNNGPDVLINGVLVKSATGISGVGSKSLTIEAK
jgi:hypothetical protein